MNVRILTPLGVLLDRSDIEQVSARDDSGAFAIRAGHAGFVTVLPPAVVTLRLLDGTLLYAALSGGMLRADQEGVVITGLDGAIGTDLAPLAAQVQADHAALLAQRVESRALESKLNATLIHHLLDNVAADRGTGAT